MIIKGQNISVFEYLFLIFITVEQKGISCWLAELKQCGMSLQHILPLWLARV